MQPSLPSLQFHLLFEYALVPGIKPKCTVKMMESPAKVCGATITAPVRDGLAKLPPGHKDAESPFGVDLSSEQCKGPLEYGVAGLRTMTP